MQSAECRGDCSAVTAEAAPNPSIGESVLHVEVNYGLTLTTWRGRELKEKGLIGSN